MGIWDWRDLEVRKAVRGIMNSNLCISGEDQLLILTDTFKERVGELIFAEASRMVRTKHLTYEPTGESGIEPPEPVWRVTFGDDFVREMSRKGLLEKVMSKTVSEGDEEEIKEILLETTAPSGLPTAVIAVNRYSISHTLFRKLCTEFLTMRFVSMPLFEGWMFHTSMQADWKEVEKRSRAVADVLTEADSALLTCPLGTEIELGLVERVGLADTGRFCKPGDFGNLPAGEAFIAPLEGTSNGKFTTLWAPTRKLESPTTFEVREGRVVNVDGDRELSSWFENLSHREENASNIAELGVGTNDRAERFDNILEAEKIMGTCHIAIGDNSSFGGMTRANVHVDFVIENPTLILKSGSRETVILENGKFLL